MIAPLTVLLYVINLTLLIALHLNDHRIDLRHHTVSAYALGPGRRLFVAYGLVGTMAALGLAWLAWHATAPALPGRAALYLTAMAAARLGVVAFPTDGTAVAPRTLSGGLHLGFASAAFALAYMAIAVITDGLSGAGDTPILAAISGLRWIAAASLAAVVLTIAGPLSRWFGLAERAYLFAVAVSFLAISLHFLLG